MFESENDIYLDSDFFKLTIPVQNEIIKSLIENKDFKLSKNNIDILVQKVEVSRINYYIEKAIDSKKPKAKKYKKVLVKEDSE
jgi:hypothetical protein